MKLRFLTALSITATLGAGCSLGEPKPLPSVRATGLAAQRDAAPPPAAVEAAAPVTETRSLDPIEGANRVVHRFNDGLDVYVLEPVATGWEWVVPDPIETALSNFFWNLRFPIIAGNDLLQAKPMAFLHDVGRFGLNTTVGLAGFFDPATPAGLARNDEDFGQTLGYWGVPAGPPVVLPFLGPSNPRDAVGLAVDYVFSVTPFFVGGYYVTAASVVEVVNLRAQILADVRNAKSASVDYYVFLRDAYRQRREAKIRDQSEEPREDEEELYFFDDEESE